MIGINRKTDPLENYSHVINVLDARDTTPRVLCGDHQPNSHASGHGIPDRREERCSPTTALTGQPFLPDIQPYQILKRGTINVEVKDSLQSRMAVITPDTTKNPGPGYPGALGKNCLPPQRFLTGRRTAPSLFFNGRRTAPSLFFIERRTALLLKNRGRRNPAKCPLNKEIARQLCYEGFSYTKKKETKSTIRWECSQRRSDNCKGTVTSDNPDPGNSVLRRIDKPTINENTTVNAHHWIVTFLADQ
ncbi:hypothetical protein DPMN_016916 [Dreissena polymorpha]|uniref:FLYWCH-type domain-containing protein n=1 Tax=Dreissena polymorpha TaxID=45954 RepID=A0A9D4NAI7_DREPO|nr:hypothetical protein DPMN_016916 [Dreissena polymorpha]